MSVTKLTAFVDRLRENRLLGPDELDEIGRQLLPRYSDERTLAKYLVQRGWLTVYQVNQLLHDHGHDLVLGPYRILERLGEGAFSLVYRAWHTGKRHLIALKVLRRDCLDTTVAVAQFEREIEAMTRLAHPNIVTVVEVGHVGARRFLAMDCVEGTDLGKFVRLSGPLPVGHACDYIRQAALGLQHAHECRLVHRDIKPANLFLITPADEGPKPGEGRPVLKLADQGVIKILDWGLARVDSSRHGTKSNSDWIQPGSLIGTADYMAPEQARNPRKADIRADIYSLGSTFYYLLTGHPLFPGNSLMQKLYQHEEAEPPAVEALRPDLPRVLPPLLQKMLAKDPKDRPQVPLAIAAALAPFCRLSRTPPRLAVAAC